MSKFFVIVIVGLLCCNTANALPKCEGENHRNWTNCEGSLDYTDKIYLGNGKTVKEKVAAPPYLMMDTNTLENLKMMYRMGKEL